MSDGTLPPFVRLLGVDICIREAQDWELDVDDTAKCFPHAALIIYDPGTDEQELRDTVLHEIIHMIDFKMNGDYTIKDKSVCQLAAVLYPFLKDNCHFTDWIVSEG
jgi:hypothetical protein